MNKLIEIRSVFLLKALNMMGRFVSIKLCDPS